MAHAEYNVRKLRFGGGDMWCDWEYEAVSTRADYSQIGNADRGVTGRYSCLDSLAQELATFPGASNAEYFSTEETRVLLNLGTLTQLTQRAIVNDEELGELAILILKYTREKKKV
ncbi:hypothetical protein HZC30_01230 [Candidatus Woesearchaeota archaeon]|nr:hypothetical protein [Candidatus Woesearchaeota archaeon]